MARGNNEGTIYKRRSDGRYAAAVTLDTGKRKTVYGRTREEAAAKLQKLQTTVLQGLPLPDERTTLRSFMENWLETGVKPSARASTYASYSNYVRRHIIPELGRVRLTKLTPQMVETFLQSRLKAGLSPRSVNHIRAVLRAALNKALRWGLVSRNVAALAGPQHLVAKEPSVLTAEQASRLLEGVAEDRLGALYVVALTVGLRLGEALGLQWSDVDLDAGTLRVRHALQRVNGHATLVEPKSTTSRRTICLPALTIDALANHRKAQTKELMKSKARWPDSDFVFRTPAGMPLNPSSTTRRFRQVLADLELPQMRFHDLRHSAATLLISQNVHPRLVMELLGHSQISLTMNTYAHVIPAMQRETANQMDRLLAAGR